jgi:hypothetical protein
MKLYSPRTAISFAWEGALAQANTQRAEPEQVGLQTVSLLDRGTVLLRRRASGLPSPLSGS